MHIVVQDGRMPLDCCLDPRSGGSPAVIALLVRAGALDKEHLTNGRLEKAVLQVEAADL